MLEMLYGLLGKKTFRCAMCGEMHIAKGSELDAIAEAIHNYGLAKALASSPVCDRCFEIFKPMPRGSHPRVGDPMQR